MNKSIDNHYSAYLKLTAALTFILIFLAYVLNSLVDPMWHYGGNKLEKKNYVDNERISKTNHYLNTFSQYDCIILGSSKSTLLDSKLISSHRCFNFAFSAATANELVDYVKYINAKGKPPKLAIVGIDGRNFWRDQTPSKSPDFILNLENPPPPWHDYLSLSALRFSLRTLLFEPPLPRYYGADFSPQIRASAPYKPPSCVYESKPSSRRYSLDNTRHYAQIKKLWPNTTLIGYVSPISAWNFSQLYLDKTLTSYTQVLYETSKIFDDFYDFTIPSPITSDASQSYDNEHYRLETNRKIADVLMRKNATWGVHLLSIDYSKYEAEFAKKVQAFMSAKNIEFSKDHNCLKANAAR